MSVVTSKIVTHNPHSATVKVARRIHKVANKYIGRVIRSDLEGGAWTLVCDNGLTYQLSGGDAGLRVDGQRVEVVGRVDADRVGIAMVGDVLEVKSYRCLD
jgi:hypothetical protein